MSKNERGRRGLTQKGFRRAAAFLSLRPGCRGSRKKRARYDERMLCMILAICMTVFSACRPMPQESYSEPDAESRPAAASPESPAEKADPEKETVSGQKPEDSGASQGSPPSESEPAVILPPSSSRPSPSSSSSSVPAPADGEQGQADPLLGKNVSLLEWQWVDDSRLALLAYYADTDETLALLYSRKDSAVKTLACFTGKPQSVAAPFYEKQLEFRVDSYFLSMERDGEQLDIGSLWEDSSLLPEDDADYAYGGLAFSSSRKYFFYERFPSKYKESSFPVSDRLLIGHASSEFEHTPAGEIAFPFDVRVTPKRVLWLNGSERLLVEADVPQKEQYDTSLRTYYVYDTSGRQLATFTVEDGLTLRDSFRSLLLFERAGEAYELLCYDYVSKKSQSVMKLEGENRAFGVARFSPDGQEIAVLRPATDLTPQFYPVPEMG